MKYKAILTAITSYLAYLLGGLDKGIEALLVMTLIDYCTGILKAIVNKNLSSYIGWRGIIKKASIFICVMVAVQMERLTNQPETIHNVVAFAFVANEAISIIENIVELGVPVPDFFIKYLKKFKESDQKGT